MTVASALSAISGPDGARLGGALAPRLPGLVARARSGQAGPARTSAARTSAAQTSAAQTSASQPAVGRPSPGRPADPAAWPAAEPEPDGSAGAAAGGEHLGTETVVDLVRRARAGESAAFGELYDLYVRFVHRYVALRVESLPAAEDIVSETFLRAWRRIDTFAWQGRDIGAWFITIARHLIIDNARASRTRLEFPVGDVPVDPVAAAPADPEQTVLAQHTRGELTAALHSLRPDQRECLMLRFVEGLSVRETALAMGRGEGAVKALQFRAARSLARALNRSGSG